MKFIRQYKQPLSLFLTCLMVFGTLSCYSRRSIPNSRLSKIDLQSLQFIVVDPNAPKTNMWLLSGETLEESAIDARFQRASPEFVRQFSNMDKKGHQNHVLLYVRPDSVRTYGDLFHARLSFQDITRIEVFEPDAGKTVGLVLACIAATAGVAVIALAIACACPYVYTETPEGNRLAGELYAGAAYPQLERHDWLPLPPPGPGQEQYTVTLANRLFENQHTNLLELDVIDAASGIRPLIDKYGRLHTIVAPQAPTAAISTSGQDVLAQVQAEDDNIFRGDLQNDRPDATEWLTLTFPKPAGAKQAKFLINAKNNFWMDYVYHEFQGELGVYAPRIRQQYLNKPASENLAWMDRQKMPLAVWIETAPDVWKKSDYFNIAGPAAFRNDILVLDLSHITGNSVRLRLEYGFNFWEIDYAALDYSADVPVIRRSLSPASAITQTGDEVAPALEKDDGQYYDQPNTGDEARISFTLPPVAPGNSRNLILHAKGHYEIRYEPASGHPNIFRLKAWEKENALPRFSRALWWEAKEIVAN